MKDGFPSAGIAIALPLFLMVFLSGCINVLPLPTGGETNEARNLAKTLMTLAPEAKELLLQEHNVANELKITLEESAQLEPAKFREKFNNFLDSLIAIRDKRRQIQSTVRQGNWQSPMVFVVQQDAIRMMQDDISRTQSWIQFAQNVRLRADLGRQKDFPEFALLSHQLDSFLGQTAEDPLSSQVRSLQEEFRFGTSDINDASP